MSQRKPGFKTTEFWLAVGSHVVGMLVLTGVLSPADGAQVQTATAEVVTQVAALVAAVAPLVSYIRGRSLLKSKE